jgi:hypothetical protein
MFRLLFLLVVVSTLNACMLDPCMDSKGNPVRTAMDVSAFHSIALQSSMEVHLSQGADQAVVIEAPPDLVELVTLVVEDGTLSIRTEECIAYKGTFVIHITSPDWSGITVQGSGTVSSVTPLSAERIDLQVQGSGDLRLELDADRVETLIQGSGNIILNGRTGNLEAVIQGSGDILAAELISGNVGVTVMGSGNVDVHCNGMLNASIMGSGDITYRGSPQKIEQEINGSGSINAAP